MLKDFLNFWAGLGWLANFFTIILGLFTVYASAKIYVKKMKGKKISRSNYTLRPNKHKKLDKELDTILADILVWKSSLLWLEKNENYLIENALKIVIKEKKDLNTKEDTKEFIINVEKHLDWMKKILKKGNSEIDISTYLNTNTTSPKLYCKIFRLFFEIIQKKNNNLPHKEKILLCSLVEKIESYYC